MFQSARIRLTAWYLLIIMLISMFFSVIIYLRATEEVNRVLRIQRYYIEHPEAQLRIIPGFPGQIIIPNQQFITSVDPDLLEEAKTRILVNLLITNGVILILSGGAGYFLAGRTLGPIKKMLDEQNRFITDASHELRTPLTSLKSSIEVNLRDQHLSIQDAKKLLQSNLEDVDSLQILSEGLLQLAQYENKRAVHMVEEVSIENIISLAVKKVSSLAKVKHIKVEVTTEDAIVKADKRSVIDVFVILLDNAIKYSPDKSTITISSEQKKNEQVVIHVADQGMGISLNDLPHIFDRFYRADASRSKKNIPGYGLGLSIAKKIVEEHDGSITVTSEVDKGTVFSVSLPIV